MAPCVVRVGLLIGPLILVGPLARTCGRGAPLLLSLALLALLLLTAAALLICHDVPPDESGVTPGRVPCRPGKEITWQTACQINPVHHPVPRDAGGSCITGCNATFHLPGSKTMQSFTLEQLLATRQNADQ